MFGSRAAGAAVHHSGCVPSRGDRRNDRHVSRRPPRVSGRCGSRLRRRWEIVRAKPAERDDPARTRPSGRGEWRFASCACRFARDTRRLAVGSAQRGASRPREAGASPARSRRRNRSRDPSRRHWQTLGRRRGSKSGSRKTCPTAPRRLLRGGCSKSASSLVGRSHSDARTRSRTIVPSVPFTALVTNRPSRPAHLRRRVSCLVPTLVSGRAGFFCALS